MAAKKQEDFRVGVIGYSSAFNMGQLHLSSMAKNEGVEVAAVCELDPERRQVAEEDFPGIKTYGRVGTMLRNANLDLVTIITPHNTHAKLAVQCLNAGVFNDSQRGCCNGSLCSFI